MSDFGFAIDALKAGYKVARKGWNGRGMSLFLQRPDTKSLMTQPYVYITTVTGDLIPWVASQPDILSEDWEIVD